VPLRDVGTAVGAIDDGVVPRNALAVETRRADRTSALLVVSLSPLGTSLLQD